MAERPLYTLYKNLKAQNYDVPDDYNKFESALTRDGKGGADNRHAIYENLKAQNFDVPSTYERFYSALFEPRSKTSSRAKGGSVPMSAADRARFSSGAAAISASAQQTMNNAGRYNRLKQRKQKQQKDFGRVNLGTHQTPYGGDANNVVKDDFAYNPETGKAGAYVTSDNENAYSLPEAEQMQAILDKQNDAYQVAVDTGEIPSAFDVRDKNGNYDLQENIGKNGTYLTEEGAQKQFDKKLADAYARKKEIEALIAEDNRQHGNPLLSYGASIGASNGRTAEQSDYRNKLATSLSLVTEQIGALEAVKQYPTSSWGEDALKALDNTAFTAKTWDFGLTDFAIMGQMERIKTKIDNKIPLSVSDKMLLKSKLGADAAAALEDEKMGNIYRWTKIAGQSLPFMADFFLTGGYGGITKGISRGALKFAAKRGMGKVGAAILKNTGIVAGDVIGSYAMAGTEQALKTGADIMQRHLGNLYQDEKGDYKFGTFDENGNLLHEGGESIGTALYKGMTSAMVENYTEKLFGHNYGIKKGAINFMEKHGMNASAEFFKNIGKSGWYTNSKKWMEKFGINGFAEEVMEEEIGIPLHALLDGEGKVSDLLDAKQQLDIIGGMAISVGSMYAMGAGSRPVKGIYNRAQYYRFRNKVNVADIDAQNLMGDNWADIKDKIDNATNEQMGGVLADILRQRDTMTKEQINAAVNYGVNLMKMRGYNIAKTAEMNAKEITNEPTTPEEQHQADIDNAYSEGHDTDDADKHDMQIQQEDQMKTLAAALGISEQQLSAMSDEELESLTGQDDKLDQAIYDYQLSSARYQGVVDDAQDKVDLAAHQAEQRVDMYTDQSRGSVRNATIKASGGLEDYGVYIISGNIATHDDGSIDVNNSDDMILYYDPTTNSVEHADALMFAELGEELPADDVKAQAVADAKENAIKEVAGIIDGTVEVGSQFSVTDADGTEHTYEVLADYGDGTAAISIDGNVVENPYSLADLQQMKDLEDQKKLETAKAEREQMEKERAAQQNQETEQTQPSFDFNQILNDNGNVVLVDVLDKDGNTKYPDSRLFLIRDAGAKAKIVELKSDGTIVPHAVNKEDVATISSMSLDEYKQAMPESSMIEDNSGEESDEDSQLANLGLPKGSEIWMSGDGFGRPKESTLSKVVGIDEQSSIILEDKDGKKWSASFDYINNHRELPPLDENTNIVNEENNQSESNAEENTPAPEQTPAMTLEDGTIVPMLEDGNPDFSKLTAAQTAELYDTQFGEDADSILSGYVSDAKKALDKANSMTVKGKTFVEQKAAKDAKEKAIADAQAAYDSAIAIRDAYNERQLAKVEDTAEGRRNLIEKARRKFARLKSTANNDAEAVSQLYRDTIGSLLHRLYDGTGIDVTDTIPLTAEEYVASNLGAHSLNYEGTETSKGVKQETGLSREDFAKTQLLAADGKGTTIDALVHSLWENRPSNLESLDTQEIRNALIGVLNSGFKASEARNFVENIRIAQAENILEEQKRAQENAAYAEQHKAEQEAELKAKSDEKAELKAKSEAKLDNEPDNKSNDLSNESDNEKINDNINDNINTLTPEQQKAKEDGEKLGFPAVDNEGEPINQYVIELANWAKEQGLEIDPTSKLNSYADLFLMCKDGFGVSTLVPDEGENINQVVYFPDNVQDFDQLWKLQEEFNAGRDLKHSSNIDSEITEGAMFYDADTAREFKEFVDKKVEEQNKVFGEQRSEEDLPFSAKENGTQQTTSERAADVEKNKVDDMKVVDNIVGQKTRKAFERLAKMMGANIQWQYSDKLGNGWIQKTTDADGNVRRTIFITLDSSITEGAQFIFGHEMTHQIKNLNPAAYNELTQLVLDTYGSDAFDKAVDETMQRYSDAGFSGRARDYYAEEVVADAVGEMIRDLNLAHTLAMKMSHPLLAAIHEILQKIKLAFFGTEYSDVTKNIIRSIEQAYVKTANGQVTNSETGEDVSFSLRQKPEPKKKGIGYKVFVLKDGKLYPPMVANPNGAATPVGVWLDADAAPIAGESKTGRPQVKQGGKGTQGGSGKLAYRPGWHLGVVPYAIQFNRKDAEGNKTLFPKNFVFAEVEYAADVDYQEEARQEGINPSGKYQHSLAGLKHLPTDGYYMYRTNPNPETDPWVITGAMKVNRILTRAEQAELVKNAGREPQQIQEGDIVTDDVVNSINQEIADAPKFSLKVYHGSGAMQITEHTKFSLRLKSAIEETETNPSDAQKESGNYKKGHIKFGGYDYTIENPKGSTRSGKDADGKEWKVTMHDTYGYIRGKFGKDGDHLDMFINDKADLDNWNGDVFVVDQVNPDGSFDEHKVMYGYDSMDDAKKAYLANYSKGWQGLGNITGASKDEFDKWLDTSNRKLKPFADYAKVKFSLKDIKPVGVGAFGNIYNQFRGNAKAAIEFLKKVRGGEAVGALHHKDIGDIDLVWGKEGTGHSDGYGLSKLVKYHPEILDNLQEILNDMRVVLSSKNRVNLESETHKAGVRLTWDGERKSWLLTAFKKETSASDKRTDTAATSLEGDTALSQTEGSVAKIDNSSETAKENGEKFSLKDEKTLAGVHNITEEKLRKALKLGGFANPSLAVIDTNKSGHNNFGEISFIAPSALLDKRTGKTGGTWITDAYTQRYPSVERQMSEKGSQKFEDWVDSLEYPSAAKAEIKRQTKDVLEDNGVPAWELMYLKEKGIDIKAYDSNVDYRWKEIISDHPTAEDILGSMQNDPELKEKVTSLAKHAIIYPTWEKVSLEVRRKMYKETGVKASPINPQVRKQTKEIFERDYKSTLLNKDGSPRKKDVKKVVEDIVKEHNDIKKYDFYLSKVKASNYVNKNGLYDDYIRWQENKLDEFGTKNRIFRGYTRDGSRKYVPETLENVSKAMREEADGQTNGSEYTSFGSFIAKLASRVDSTDEMRANKDKLSSNEDKEEFYEKWSEVYYDLAKFLYNDVFYGEQRLHDIVLQSDPKKYAKKEYGITLTPTFMKKLDALKNAVQTELKSAYFETKYNRPLRLNEFAAVVVPDNLGEDVRKGIENAGLPMYDYDPNKEGDRSRAFNEAINSSDNIRFSLKSMMAKPEGWKQANKKAIHIAEAIERDPKFSLKNLDGTLIKAGTYFSGGGLVEEGLKGIIDPVLAVEYDEKISGVYRNNFGQHIVTADVRDVDPKELVKQIDGEVEYFHASPVCKNYSQAKSNHAEVELDKETAASTAEFINAIKPKVVTIENVKGYKDSDAMKTITDALDANGYTWDADVYNAADYGGYTNRERLIVRAVRDGKLPEKPKKMAHKSGWYEAVADIIPTLTEKKNGVAPWMDIRLKADGIDWRNIDKPLYVMGSAYADGKIPHAFADELLPTLRTKSGDVIVMPDGKVYRAMGRVLARVSGVSDDYKMPFSESLSHTIIGNGIPTQLTEHVIAPLLTGSDPKFSIRTYHGTGASFDKFDLSHALEGEGSESFGHGVYVTNSSKIGREYAQRAKNRKMEDLYKNMRYPDGVKGDIFKRRVFGEMVNDVATGGSVASAKEFAKKRVGADANDIQRTLENLKDREKGTEYEQNLKDRLAEYKEGLNWIDSLDEDYLTQGNVNRYDVDIPDDNGSNYLDWEGTIPDSLDKQKVAEDAYKVVSDNQGFNDFKATPLNDFIAHTLKTYINTTDVAGRVEKLKSDIKDVIENYVADDDVLALNEYLKDATPDDVLATIWYNDLVRDIKDADLGEELYRKLSTYVGDNAASQILSDNGLVGIKYPAGMIHGGAKEGDYNYVIFDENNANIVGNTRFSLRYDQFEHDLNKWKKDNNLPKDAQRPTIPQRNAGESAVDFLRRVDEYRKQMALWKTAPTYEQHLLSDDTALGEFNRELQRGSVLKRIAFQDSMLAIRKAQEAIMKEVGVDRLNMAEDAYTAENRSLGKGKNEFEEYNNEFLQPLRKAYHQMKKVLGDSYDNVRIYMMAKHGLERDAQMAFKKSLEADYEDVAQRSAAYKAYKGDMNRIINDSDLEFGRVDFTTWRQRDNALRAKYSPSYMNYRYDKNGIAYDYSGLSALFDGSDFEEAAYKLVKDIEDKYVTETHDLWDATNAATKKILRDGYKAGMMSKDTYQYVRDMYSHYIPLRGWDGTTADQVWDYIGGGKGAFNQTLKKAHGRTSIADDPIAYIENMAESGILLNNKNWVKQHLMLLAQNHPTSLLTLSKAWYVKSVDDNGNEEWIPATPQITSQMDSNQVKAAIDAFEKKMEKMAQTGDATQKRDGLNIAYPQTHSEEREHEVRVMKDGEEYVIYVNGDPQLAQAINNTRAHRVREIQSGKLDRAAAWLGRKMAAAYTSLSPLFIPSNYFRDLTMTLASTAIREDAKYNYLLRKNLATSWNLGFMLRDYQNGKLRDKVNNGNATPKEQMFYDFMMNGGETGFVSSLDVEDLKKKFKNDLKDLDRWKANPVKVGHTIMDGIEFLNRAIEDSNRFAVYMTSIQYGRSIDEAVNDAKDVTLNFNRKGTGEYGWQMIRNLYLFINPAVQSLQTLGALVKHHPFKFTAVTASWLASGVLVPIVNAALMSMLGGDDDKDKYWQFTKWDRRNNLIMWVPFTHEYIKIPLAQEFRAFYGIGDMIASKMIGGELAEESWNQYAEDLLGQVVDMLPLDPTGYDGNIAVSLMPNAIRPVFELAFNVDFTGKPLFKETEYNKYDPNFTKAYVGTPDWLVRASRMVNSIGNDYPDVQQNSIDAFGDPKYNLNNPAVVDHVLSSYLGGAYTMGCQVLGVLTKSLNDPKEIKVADIPLVSKFVSNPDDRPVTKKQGDEFWNMKENHDRAANTLSKLKKQAKVDGDYSMLERFYGSEEYKQYKQDDVKVKKYEEDKKKERAEESGEEYRPHKLNAEDIYKAHATPKDDFEDLKLKQLYTKLNGFKTSYDLLVDTAPGQSDGYYNTNKVAIDAIDEISLDKQEISELKKGFLDDGKDAYNAEDMKQIRELRKKILAVLEKANKVVVANQKAKAEK